MGGDEWVIEEIMLVAHGSDHNDTICMAERRIVEQGIKKEILAPPHHEYTDLLLSSVPEMDPDWLENLLKERKEKGKPSTIMEA